MQAAPAGGNIYNLNNCPISELHADTQRLVTGSYNTHYAEITTGEGQQSASNSRIGQAEFDNEIAADFGHSTKNPVHKLLNLQGLSTSCLEADQDDEAYGLTSKQYELGPAMSYIPVLVNYYHVLFTTQREGECKEVLNQITSLLKANLHFVGKDYQTAADAFYKERFYIKALIFYQIAVKLYFEEENVEEIMTGLLLCCDRLKQCVEELVKICNSYQEPCRVCIIPAMHDLAQQITTRQGKSKKLMVITKAGFLHIIELSDDLVGDIKDRQKTLEATIKLFYDCFEEEEAETFYQLATAYNNLGSAYIETRQPVEAIRYLKKSIEVHDKIQDFTFDRDRNLAISQRALKQAEELLAALPQ